MSDSEPAGAGSHTSVVVEADGGSRGNPGPAAYGAVLRDAHTGQVIEERAECIGVATNNVAEYRGLIAGLEMYLKHSPDADLEVRLDSKLVVEQMSGRWKVKHPDMIPLATAAHRLAPFGTRYTWVPREQNKHADRILNEALDAAADKPPRTGTATVPAEEAPAEATAPSRSGEPPGGTPTTLILVRHGETTHTRDEEPSGRGDPPLSSDGQAQARAVADWLSPVGDQIDAVVSSPLRRTRESAQIIAERLGRTVEVEEELAGPAPGAGDPFQDVDRRVRRARDRLIAGHPGQTVLVVTDVTPIKAWVRTALGAPPDAVHRMELAPASVSVISWFEDGQASLRMFNAQPLTGW